MMKKLAIGLFWAAALAVAFALPTPEQKPVALMHVEQVHVLEPGETIIGVAKRYFKEQYQYDSIERYIFAVRLANGGLEKQFKAGDRIIIPLAIPASAK